jgi:hypothetical protein
MKLSKETVEVLKNYGNINQGMYFRQGKTLRTVNSHKNILTSAEISEDFPINFGVYDINNFLGVISADDSPEFEFSNAEVNIKCKGGRSTIRYGFCDADVIVTAPEKDIVMPSEDVKFDLSKDDLQWVLQISRLLSTPHIIVESDGTEVLLKTTDLQMTNASNSNKLKVADGNGSKYNMIFRTEFIEKLMSGNYGVTISAKGIAHFQNNDRKIQYWITTETGSKFEAA